MTMAWLMSVGFFVVSLLSTETNIFLSNLISSYPFIYLFKEYIYVIL